MDSSYSAFRELRVRFDLADLENVTLFVCGDQHRPLIGVAILPLHKPAAQIISRSVICAPAGMAWSNSTTTTINRMRMASGLNRAEVSTAVCIVNRSSDNPVGRAVGSNLAVFARPAQKSP